MEKNPNSNYKIRFNDCDMFGHLNNSRYLDYIINAREDHLKDVYNFDLNHYYKNDLAWVIGSHEIVYLRSAVFNEIVSIQTSLIEVTTDLLFVEALMMNAERNQLKAIMRTKLIPVNIKTGRKEKHQPEFMDWANQLVNERIDNRLPINERIKQLSIELKNQDKL